MPINLNIGSQKGSPTVMFASNVPEKQAVPEPVAKVYEAERDLATGFAKGGTQTLLGIGGIGSLIQRGLASAARGIGIPVSPQAAGEMSVFNKESAAGQEARRILEPTNTGERVGKTLEQAAEYFVPAGAASKAEKTVTVASQMINSPFLAATSRVLGTALSQAVPAGAVKLAQTGGDVDEALETAAFAGVARGGLQVIGEGAGALKIPERLYTTIFKNTKKDMLAELRAGGIEKIRRTDPGMFDDLVRQGIIKGDKGIPVVNETLAEEALNRGLKGSIDDMASEVVRGSLKSESAVRNIAKNYQGTVNLTEEQFPKVLKELAQEYDSVGFGEIAVEANKLADDIVSNSGQVSAETALDVRRFLDKMRLAASFEKPITKLSTAEANLKTLADTVRGRLKDVPGMGDVMKDYSFYIEALDSLAQAAKQAGNNQVLSLIDSIFLAGAAGVPATGSGSPLLALGAGLANKLLLKDPGTATSVAQTLNRGVAGPALSGTLGSVSSGAATVTGQ